MLMAQTAHLSIPIPLIDTANYLDHHPHASITIPSFAPNDYYLCIHFLKQYASNNATFESYRREVERLLQWTWLIAEQSLLNLKREDLEHYLKFCMAPPKTWIGYKKVSRFITKDGTRMPNPVWRPFVVSVTKTEHSQGIKPQKQQYELSQKAIREIFTILSSFYNYLALEGHVSLNPIALIKQKSKYLQKRQQQSPVMRLSETQWQVCLDTVHHMATHDAKKHARTLFIISALYLLYLRVSELVASERWTPQMDHFFQDAHGAWWFKVVGKGNKMRDIAVSDDMLTALKKYRESMQLPSLPTLNDKTPLLPKERGKGPITSPRHVRRLVQTCFDETIQRLRAMGLNTDADALGAATVHWLRHTGISDDINKRGRPIAHVRDDAGHSSSAITDRYNDIDLIERHQSAKNKTL